MLKIFNTLTRKKEQFVSINPGKINIYVCGITVYDFCHVGHARIFIFFDFVVRYLRYSGYIVNYVRNITDIDDKILCRALQNNEPYKKLTNRMIEAMHQDFDVLNILRPDHEPRVTQYIGNIIEHISYLFDKNFAYIASNGDVLFSIKHLKKYSILSHQNLEKLHITNRSNIGVKRHPMDFVLWKKHNQDHNPIINSSVWTSPWGLGRPGWHIECSVMSSVLLGKYFDIHGGGSDLIFPHHENELAQSTAIHDTPYVKVWMHVGLVMNNAMKMSKSLNNFFTIRDMLQIYDAETIRYFLLSSHYRSTLDYTNENLKRSRKSLEHLYRSLIGIDNKIAPNCGEYFVKKFISAINNDFNTPRAYSILFEIAHAINYLKRQNKNSFVSDINRLSATLRYLGSFLGLLNQKPEDFLKKQPKLNLIKTQDTCEKIELLIGIRNDARRKKEWLLADQLRQQLFNLNVKLEDTPQGTKWKFID